MLMRQRVVSTLDHNNYYCKVNCCNDALVLAIVVSGDKARVGLVFFGTLDLND